MPRTVKDIDLGNIPPDQLIETARVRGCFVFDLETTGLNAKRDRIEGVAFYVPEGPENNELRAWYPFVPHTMRVWVHPDETIEEQAARLKYERTRERAHHEAWVELRQKPEFVSLLPALDQEDTMEALRPLFEESPDVYAVAHNAKFDVAFLRWASGCQRGYWQEISAVDRLAAIGRDDEDPGPWGFASACCIADSMQADFLCDENFFAYGLKGRVKHIFGHDMVTYMDVMKRRNQGTFGFMSEEVEALGTYAMSDCQWTWRLFEHSLETLNAQTPGDEISDNPIDELAKLDERSSRVSPFDRAREMGNLERIYWNIDMKITLILEEMEQRGILIDWKWLKQVTEKLEVKKDSIIDQIEKHLGFTINPNSAPQVSTVLFAPQPTGLGIPTKGIARGKSGMYSTGSKEISHLSRAHPVVKLILDWRSADTIQANFSIKLAHLAAEEDDSRCYSHFKQQGTKIHRLSSADPINLQNLPRDRDLIRKAVCAHLEDDPDPRLILLGADYGQIELRVAAHLSGDLGMIEVYNMVGGCKADGGQPCARYRHWECDECGNLWIPLEETPTACAKCGDAKIAHQRRCRHVDLHQRTAEDVDVKRNPLAKCLDASTLVLGMQGKSWIRPATIKSLIGDIEPGEHRPVLPTVLHDGRGGERSAFGTTVARSALKRCKRSTKIVVTKRAVVIATEDHRFQVIGDYDSLDPATPGYVHVPGMSLVEAQNLEKRMKLPFSDMAHPHARDEARCERARVLSRRAKELNAGDETLDSLRSVCPDEVDFHEICHPGELNINPFTKEVDSDGPASIKLDKKWAYFAGMFAGDGCASGNACTVTHGSTPEYAEWRNVVREACDAVGLPNRVSKNKKHTVIGSRVVRRYFAGLGLAKEAGKTGAKIMRVPEWVLSGGPGMMWSYLAGLFDTDGTVGSEKSGTVSVTTKHPEFAGQIAFLLRWLGMPILLQPGYNKTYERWYYTVHVLAEGFSRFLKYCPMRYCEKVEKLRTRDANVKRRIAPDTDEVLLVLDGGERTVYDFQVESDDHLYLQGGLIGHNNLNFGSLYRIGPERFCQYADLYDERGEPRVEYARGVLDGWYEAYPAIEPFQLKIESMLRGNGWISRTITGRQRRLAQERYKNDYRAVTQGIQFAVSGSAQDILKIAMVRIWEEKWRRVLNTGFAERKLWEQFCFLLQVHDEIVCQSPVEIADEAEVIIKEKMESAAELRVPLVTDVKRGRSWDNIH